MTYPGYAPLLKRYSPSLLIPVIFKEENTPRNLQKGISGSSNNISLGLFKLKGSDFLWVKIGCSGRAQLSFSPNDDLPVFD